MVASKNRGSARQHIRRRHSFSLRTLQPFLCRIHKRGRLTILRTSFSKCYQQSHFFIGGASLSNLVQIAYKITSKSFLLFIPFLANRHSSLHEISVTEQQFKIPKLQLFKHSPITNKNVKSRHQLSPLLPVDTNPVVIQLVWLFTCTFLGFVLNANITTAIQQHSGISIHVSYDSRHHTRTIVHIGHYTTVLAFVSSQLNRTFLWNTSIRINDH